MNAHTRALIVCAAALAATAHQPRAEERASARHLGKELKHSHIALMPEWRPDDIGTFRPLEPSVVAWGTDPVHSLGRLLL